MSMECLYCTVTSNDTNALPIGYAVQFACFWIYHTVQAGSQISLISFLRIQLISNLSYNMKYINQKAMSSKAKFTLNISLTILLNICVTDQMP